jgi:hypothetical protein
MSRVYPPSRCASRLRPLSVRRYFCLLLRGLSGMVISIRPTCHGAGAGRPIAEMLVVFQPKSLFELLTGHLTLERTVSKSDFRGDFQR